MLDAPAFLLKTGLGSLVRARAQLEERRALGIRIVAEEHQASKASLTELCRAYSSCLLRLFQLQHQFQLQGILQLQHQFQLHPNTRW